MSVDERRATRLVTRPEAFAIRAEWRALLYSHPPRLLEETEAGRERRAWHVLAWDDPWELGRYRVDLWTLGEDRPGVLLVFDCDCPSGRFRHELPVPCKHAAYCGRWLEARGLAAWREGLWYRPGPRVCPACGGRKATGDADTGFGYAHEDACDLRRPDDPLKGLV